MAVRDEKHEVYVYVAALAWLRPTRALLPAGVALAWRWAALLRASPRRTPAAA